MAMGMWPFNPKVMDNKTQHSQIYIIELVNYQGSEDNAIDDEAY
jgi:hypothetical protein